MRIRAAYAVSTLVGPWTALVVVGVDMSIAMLRGAPYVGEGMWTVRWMAIGLWMLWPVAAAAAAVDAGRLSRTGAHHLALVSRRGWRRYPWAAAWTAVPMAVTHVLIVVVLLLVGGVTSPRGGWPIIVLALFAQALTFVWFACLGSFLGRHLPVVVGGVVAAVAALLIGFTFTGTAASTPRFQILGDSGATVSQIGITWNASHLLWQILLLGTLSVLLVLPRPRRRQGVLAPSGVGIAAAVGCVAVFVAVPSAVAGVPYVAQNDRPDVCVGTAPTICYYSEHARHADRTVAQIDSLVEAARAQGYDALVPERVEERSRRYDAANGGSIASFDTLESDEVGLPYLVDSLLRPTWCSQLHARPGSPPPPTSYVDTLLQLIDTWSGLVGSSLDPIAPEHPRMTPVQVERAREAFARCELDVRP